MKMRSVYGFVVLLICAFGIESNAQENNDKPSPPKQEVNNPFGKPDDDFSLIRETPVTIDLDKKEDPSGSRNQKEEEKAQKKCFLRDEDKKRVYTNRLWRQCYR